MKREKRRKESIWLSLGTELAEAEFKAVKNQYNYLIRRKKSEYYRWKIQEAGINMAKLYRILNDLSGNTKKVLPDGMNDMDLASAFLDFFFSGIR